MDTRYKCIKSTNIMVSLFGQTYPAVKEVYTSDDGFCHLRSDEIVCFSKIHLTLVPEFLQVNKGSMQCGLKYGIKYLNENGDEEYMTMWLAEKDLINMKTLKLVFMEV